MSVLTAAAGWRRVKASRRSARAEIAVSALRRHPDAFRGAPCLRMPRQPPIATTTSAARTSSRPDGVSAAIRAFKPWPIPRRGFRWSPGWYASSDRPRLLPGAISVKAFTSCHGLSGRERAATHPGRHQQADCKRKVRRFTFTTPPHSTSRRESSIEALQPLLPSPLRKAWLTAGG